MNVYGGKDPLEAHDLTPEELTSKMHEVAASIQALFENGVPFYTKERIRDLVRQIDETNSALQSGKSLSDATCKFRLPALQGDDVAVDVETGSTWEFDGVKSVMYMDYTSLNLHTVHGNRLTMIDSRSTDPFLTYKTYQSMVDIRQMRLAFSPTLAYCPLRICYHMREIKSEVSNTPEFSLDDRQAAFRAGAKDWEASHDCTRLRTTVESAPNLTDITKIVAFACSTMCYGSAEALQASITQHAAVLTLREILRSKNPIRSETDIQCFAQDPAYTDIDKTVLQRAGITVLNDPRAFCEVDDNSIVLSVGPDLPVRQVVLDIARPAIMVWDKVLGEEETFALHNNSSISADPLHFGHEEDVDALEVSSSQGSGSENVDDLERFM